MNTDISFPDFCLRVTKGDREAASFLMGITDVAHFFDDVFDRDPVPEQGAVYDILWTAMVALPRNEFYRRHFAELNPLVANALIDWRVANRMERYKDSVHRRIAFIIRSSYVCLLQQTALIIGGPDWAEQIGYEARRIAHGEGYEEYVRSLGENNGTVQPTETA